MQALHTYHPANQECRCQTVKNLEAARNYKAKDSRFHVCSGKTGDPKRCHHNLKVIEQARSALKTGIGMSLVPPLQIAGATAPLPSAGGGHGGSFQSLEAKIDAL